jgi:hypothetical protein
MFVPGHKSNHPPVQIQRDPLNMYCCMWDLPVGFWLSDAMPPRALLRWKIRLASKSAEV